MIIHTTSHLGAQGSPYAWIMNVTFILLGLSAISCIMKTKTMYHFIFGFVFAASLMMAGIFQHASFVDGYSSVVWKDQLHSIFATLTGTSFVFLSFGHGMMSNNKQRYLAIGIAGLSTFLSLFMMLYPSIMGILQRIMFITSFYWLFFVMRVSDHSPYLLKRLKPDK